MNRFLESSNEKESQDKTRHNPVEEAEAIQSEFKKLDEGHRDGIC